MFKVNVFGAVNIIKAFLPGMIEAGPMASGKKNYVVTTSSVVGLLNHNIGPYSVSKFATTALCEQLSIELEGMENAAHISPHSLHPTVAATNFLTKRDADGVQHGDSARKEAMASMGTTTAVDIVNGLLDGLGEGKHYIVVEHQTDIPNAQQLGLRVEDIVDGGRPRKAENVGMLLAASDPEAFKARLEKLGVDMPGSGGKGSRL